MQLTSGGKEYHERNATKNPSHEKKNTLPYLSNGFNMGIDLAFWLMGLISGEAMNDLKKLGAMCADFKLIELSSETKRSV